MRRILLVTAMAMAVSVPAALAGGAGITPVSPKRGDTIPVGSHPTLTLRVRGRGAVFVRVCRSPKRHEGGVICDRESFGRARRQGPRFVYKPRFFDYPAFWLNTPGTYYWQAVRISCENGLADCRLEGPTVRFRVG